MHDYIYTYICIYLYMYTDLHAYRYILWEGVGGTSMACRRESTFPFTSTICPRIHTQLVRSSYTYTFFITEPCTIHDLSPNSQPRVTQRSTQTNARY